MSSYFCFRPKFSTNLKIGQTKEEMNLIKELNFSDHDFNIFYTVFWEIDSDDSGTIEIQELFHFFHIEYTKFNLFWFSLFDDNNSNKLNFVEFVSCFWNLLTSSEDDICRYFFKFFSGGNLETISIEHFKSMLQSIHLVSKKNHIDVFINDVLKEIKIKSKCEHILNIDYNIFHELCFSHQALLQPMKTLIFKLSNELIGLKFWDDKKFQRKLLLSEGIDLFGYIENIKKLYKSIQKEENFKKEIDNAINRRGQNSTGDKRKSILKRASMIFNYHSKIRKAPKIYNEEIQKNEISPHDHHNHKEIFTASNQKAEHIMRPRRSLFKPNLIRNFNSKDNIKIKK